MQGSTLYPIHTPCIGHSHQQLCPANSPPYWQYVPGPHPAGTWHYPIPAPAPAASGERLCHPASLGNCAGLAEVSFKEDGTHKFTRVIDCTKHHHLMWVLFCLCV